MRMKKTMDWGVGGGILLSLQNYGMKCNKFKECFIFTFPHIIDHRLNAMLEEDFLHFSCTRT